MFLCLLFILSFFVFCNKNNVVKITNLIRYFEAFLNFSRDLNLYFTVFTLPKSMTKARSCCHIWSRDFIFAVMVFDRFEVRI